MEQRCRATRSRSAFRCMLVAGFSAVLSACGGGSNTVSAPPTPVPTPTAPPQRVVAERSGVALPVDRAIYRSFDTTFPGALDATVDYTYADTRLLLWLAKGLCTPDLAQIEQCNYVATSFAGPKPRKLSATGTTAGQYTLIIGNFGPQDEAISYQVVLTPNAGAAMLGRQEAEVVSEAASMRGTRGDSAGDRGSGLTNGVAAIGEPPPAGRQ